MSKQKLRAEDIKVAVRPQQGECKSHKWLLLTTKELYGPRHMLGVTWWCWDCGTLGKSDEV